MMNRIKMGIEAPQHDVKDLFRGRVINVDRPPRDKSINDEIQQKGAEYWGPVSEVTWYKRNKGYSDRI
jgi:hypothetical protein